MHAFSFELLSFGSILDTRIREIPTMLLRIGWIDAGDGDVGFQCGPLTVWWANCAPSSC